MIFAATAVIDELPDTAGAEPPALSSWEAERLHMYGEMPYNYRKLYGIFPYTRIPRVLNLRSPGTVRLPSGR
jgi:hypothetical protein